MSSSMGIEVYQTRRQTQDIGKVSYSYRQSGTTILSSTGSCGDEISQQSSNVYNQYPVSGMEDSGNVNNRGFASYNQQPSSRHLHRVASEPNTSTRTKTGASNAFGKQRIDSYGNRKAEEKNEQKDDCEVKNNAPLLRSQSLCDNSANSDETDSIIEEKRKRANGDGYTVHRYTRGRLLGKGGFAKVYLCTAMDTGKNYAVKVVPKANLVKARARQKLQAEIKIHRNLKHKHVCQYKHYFEDRTNCYILLELCHNQSLNEMIKRRKRLTEPEAIFFVKQILSATRYMHGENVIHRDLKLGNLFLDKEMNIKVGDLGLATRLEDKDEKRKTICGTPNYIAPEIIQGDKSKRGHSFEVDVWSMGVILYTVLIGKPPYEAKDVKATYQRILNNEYSFPRHIEVSDGAKCLIQSMLQSNPTDRPSLDEIEAHPFLNDNIIPLFLPSSVMSIEPVWHLNDVGELVCTKVNQTQPSKKHLFPPTSKRQPFASRDPNTVKVISVKSSSTKTFSEPQSSINIERIGKTALAAMTATISNAATKPAYETSRAFKIYEENNTAQTVPLKKEHSLSNKEQFSSRFNKAAQATMDIVESPSTKKNVQSTSSSASNVDSSTKAISSYASMLPSNYEDALAVRTKALSIRGPSPHSNKSSVSSVFTPTTSSVATNAESDVDILKRIADHIDTILDTAEARKGSYSLVPPRPLLSRKGPSKWVTRYVDYTSKYGLGFLLNDGSSGVYFNDSTKTALKSDGNTFQYIERKKLDKEVSPNKRGETTVETHSLDVYPESLTKKVTLLKHFRHYLVEQQKKIEGEEALRAFQNEDDFFGSSELIYVKKWVRTKHAILFFLSNRTVQVVFYDQTEILCSPEVGFLTYVDKSRTRSTYHFTDELVGSSAEIEKRIKYTKEIMIQLLSGHRS